MIGLYSLELSNTHLTRDAVPPRGNDNTTTQQKNQTMTIKHVIAEAELVKKIRGECKKIQLAHQSDRLGESFIGRIAEEDEV